MKPRYLSLLFLLFCLAACGSSTQASTTRPASASASATHVVQQVTPTPMKHTSTTSTVTGTGTAAQLASTVGPTIIGGPLSNFVGRYGQPDEADPSGLYVFANKTVSVFAYSKDKYRVSAITYANVNGAGWQSLSSATLDCAPFLPGDASLKRSMAINDASGGLTTTQRVYVAPSLAPLFAASDFYDENANPATPGTIGMTFHYDSNSPLHISDCGPQVGLEGK